MGFFWPQGMWDFISPTRDQICTPCIGRVSLRKWYINPSYHSADIVSGIQDWVAKVASLVKPLLLGSRIRLCCGGGPVHCRMLANIPSLLKNVPRWCHRSLFGGAWSSLSENRCYKWDHREWRHVSQSYELVGWKYCGQHSWRGSS